VSSPWSALASRLEFSRYVPRTVDPAGSHHVDSERWGRQLVLKSPTGRYLQLSARDEFLWRAMDGARSVQDLVLLYFHRFESFSFDRVSILVRRLKDAGLLEDPPLEVFRSLRSRIERGKPEAVASRLAGVFVEHRIELRGIDRLLTVLYRLLFWPLFTRPAYAAYVVLGVVGTAGFARLVAEGLYAETLFRTEGSVAYGALTLIGATAFLVLFHQAAHVFAAKSRGREVPSAGFVISYGLPFFYAETTDVWLESRFARIMVSMAGTISDLLLGSAGAVFIVAYPESAWNPLVFKLSVVSYAALLMDLNPLFELDGYYALADYLEIPGLRSRSLGFLRRELVGKIRRRERLSHEERIYATYGVLAAAWMVVMVVAALGFLQHQLRVAVSDIFAGESLASAAMAGAVLLFFVLPVSVAILAFSTLAVWRIVRWVRRRARFRRARGLVRFLLALATGTSAAVFLAPWLVSEIVELPAAAVPLGWVGRVLPARLFLPVWTLVYPAAVPAVALAAAALARAAAREVEGSRLATTLRRLELFLLVEVARSGLEAYAVAYALESAWVDFARLVLELVAWTTLGSWALHHLFRVEFRLMRPWRKATAMVAVAGSVAAAAWLVRPLEIAPFRSAHLMLALSTTVVAVASILPALVNYSRTLLWWGWVLLLAGVGARSLAGLGRLLVDIRSAQGRVAGRAFLAGLQVSLFGAVLVLFSLVIFLAILRRMAVKVERRAAAGAPASGDRRRLLDAFGFVVESLAWNLRQAYGRRSVSALEARFNARARAKGKELRIEGGKLQPGALEGSDILAIAEEGRSCLAGIEREASSLAGSRFFRRLMTAVYDELYWAEREPVYEHLLRRFPWADEIARLPRPGAEGVEALIEASPLFEGLSAEERGELSRRMRPDSVRAGRSVFREGDPADTFYLIAEGELEVYREDAPREPIAVLKRGDYFGEGAAEGSARTASVRARTDVDLLELDRALYREYVRTNVRVAEKIEGREETVALLRKMPAFGELPLAQLALLAQATKSRTVKAGEVVVRQGEPGTALYVVRRGEVEVLVARRDPAKPPKRVAVLGPGEHFGEIALIERTPRTATVKALTDSELLMLEKDDFDRRVARSAAAMQALGRVSSRRRREIRERQAESELAFKPGALRRATSAVGSGSTSASPEAGPTASSA
jgi:putative peptide zinc metalloprotease protein